MSEAAALLRAARVRRKPLRRFLRYITTLPHVQASAEIRRWQNKIHKRDA